jgi:ABC-type Mn2+/Zn2+ transport system permease subunit
LNEAFWAPFADNEFMRHALFAGVLVSVLCAFVGVFIVLRGLAFVGDALAHGVLPGVAGAMLIGVPGIFGAAVGAGVLMGGVGLVTRRSRLSGDTAIGLFFVGMLSLGVIMTSRSSSFSGDITRILFGEILGTSTTQLLWQLLGVSVVAAVVIIFHRPFLLLTIDPDLAQTSGFNASRYNAIMLSAIAAAVLASFQTVGTLLVFGMLIAPSASAALIARRLSSMIIIAAVVGAVSTYLGLLISFHADLAAGATVVLVAVVIFLLIFVVAGSERHIPPTHPTHGAHH